MQPYALTVLPIPSLLGQPEPCKKSDEVIKLLLLRAREREREMHTGVSLEGEEGKCVWKC